MTAPDLYVGYLPLPARHARFTRVLVGSLVVLMVTMAAVIAVSQRGPGAAVWDTSREIKVRGLLMLEPYPMLIDERGHTHLIVEAGKSGPRDSIREFVGPAELTGWALARHGMSMIELRPDAGAIVRSEHVNVVGAPARAGSAQPVTVLGEILDSKCYLGAMKPGDGKAHKACATLCVRGGIPPMMSAMDGEGSPVHYLIVGEPWNSARDHVLAYIGEPVAVTGRVGQIGDMRVLVIDGHGVRRR